MNRKYPYNHSIRIQDLFTLVEGQLEFLVENEFGNISEIIDNLDEKEYDNLLTDVVNDLEDHEIWLEIDNMITELFKKRLNNISN